MAKVPKPKKPIHPRKPPKTQAGEAKDVAASNALIDRYGYVHRILYSPDAKSKAELIREAKQWLVGVARPQASITVTHPGIPRIKRGDSMRLAMPGSEKGIPIQGAILVRDFWVVEAHYSLTPGAFDMELILGTEDPFLGDPVVDKLTDTAENLGTTPPTTKKKKKRTKGKHHYKHTNEPSSPSGGAGDAPPKQLPNPPGLGK